MYETMQQKIADLHRDLGDGKWKQMIQPYIQPSRRKAIIQMINSFGPFLGIWILMYFTTMWTVWLTIPLAMVNAFFLVRIFIIQHDCGHQSFFGLRNKHLNNAIGMICSLFSTIPYKYWAKVHQFHHTHSGELEVRDIGDIPFLTVAEYQKLSRWRKICYRIYRSPVVLFFFAPIVYFLFLNRWPKLDFKGMTVHIKRHQIYNNLMLISLYVWLALLIGWRPFLLIQGSIVLFFSMIAFWFFYVQHQHEEAYNQRKTNRDFLSSAILGSTYYQLPRLWNRLTGWIGVHHIHHLCSFIPNYQLRRCLVEQPLLSKHVTKITFRESLACMRYKLRDEHLQQMIDWQIYHRLYTPR